MKDHRKIFSERLKFEIKRQEIGVAALAYVIGVTSSTIYFYTAGKMVPGFDVLMKLSKVLHVSVDWLCGLEEEVEKDDL